MQIELFNSISDPQLISARRVVIRGDHGTPLGVFVELQPGVIQCATHTDSNFGAILEALGITKTEIQIRKAPKLADYGLT